MACGEPDPNNGVCPHCGYCKHCGRGGHQTYPFYPAYPTNPYWHGGWWGIYPPVYTTGGITVGGGTTVTLDNKTLTGSATTYNDNRYSYTASMS